ncbi:MAG TPA: hypothetical protein VGN61_10875 [Verrucomicrobiae bacterium]
MNGPLDKEAAVFNEARRLSPERRAAFLDFACEGDAALLERVKALLQDSDAAEGFLANPAPQVEKSRAITDGTLIIPSEKAGDGGPGRGGLAEGTENADE